ncbi:MAG TPA: bacteriohemerythrin [Holophaga sp.]|nr:bacteriohemerythrin [Holophaga sp.]
MWFFGSKSKEKARGFAWKSREHGTGHERLDEDHRDLARRVEEVQALVAARGDRNEVYRILEQLVQATREHFQREEEAMAEAGFGGLARHAAEHEELLAQCQDHLRQYKNGSLSGLALPAFLRDWLLPHIQESDRQFVQELRRQPGKLPLG